MLGRKLFNCISFNQKNIISSLTFVSLFSTVMSTEKATFGAGCFWGTEKYFKKQFGNGIVKSQVGYTGGEAIDPNYKQVCSGKTGHAEALEVEYDNTKVKYEDLVNFFFRMHDPTTENRQGNDVGTQYRSVIFFHSEEQKKIAEKVKKEIDASGKYKNPIVTEVAPASKFYSAEEYHQQYLEKNPGGYCNHYLRW